MLSPFGRKKRNKTNGLAKFWSIWCDGYFNFDFQQQQQKIRKLTSISFLFPFYDWFSAHIFPKDFLLSLCKRKRDRMELIWLKTNLKSAYPRRLTFISSLTSRRKSNNKLFMPFAIFKVELAKRNSEKFLRSSDDVFHSVYEFWCFLIFRQPVNFPYPLWKLPLWFYQDRSSVSEFIWFLNWIVALNPL